MHKEVYEENRKHNIRTHNEAKRKRQVERELNNIIDLKPHGYDTNTAISISETRQNEGRCR